jgi:predicted ABC-type ATPase
MEFPLACAPLHGSNLSDIFSGKEGSAKLPRAGSPSWERTRPSSKFLILSAMANSPTVYVIAGPNGAGKSTFAEEYLGKAVACREFVNADLIAAELSPNNPDMSAFHAGRIMLERVDKLASNGETFCFETTLAGRSHFHRLLRMKQESGYVVAIVFVWLPSEEMAIKRVATRVKQGGHGVPESTIRGRYRKGIENFAKVYSRIADQWIIFDGTLTPPIEVVRSESGVLQVLQYARLDLVKAFTPQLLP